MWVFAFSCMKQNANFSEKWVMMYGRWHLSYGPSLSLLIAYWKHSTTANTILILYVIFVFKAWKAHSLSISCVISLQYVLHLTSKILFLSQIRELFIARTNACITENQTNEYCLPTNIQIPT